MAIWMWSIFSALSYICKHQATATFFKTDNSDLPPRCCHSVVHRSKNSVEETEGGGWVNRPCASSTCQLPLLIHHSQTPTPHWYIIFVSIHTPNRRDRTQQDRCAVWGLRYWFQSDGSQKHAHTHAHSPLQLSPPQFYTRHTRRHARTHTHSYQAFCLKMARDWLVHGWTLESQVSMYVPYLTGT